jgi:hypothetical protein
MSVTLEDVTKKRPESSAEQAAAEDLVRQAREHGLPLTGPDGLLAASVPGSCRRFAGPVSKRPGERALCSREATSVSKTAGSTAEDQGKSR